MAKVVVNNEATRNYEREVKLNNGMLVIHRNSLGEVLNTYIVTSFRNNKDNPHWVKTTNYCSLVDLENGYLAFEEPCSRSTTELRVLRHLCKCGYPTAHEYTYNDSKIAGSYIDEYVDYEIHLKTEK